MIYVTDTHSLVWFLANDSKLGKDALNAFRSADEGKSLIVIPAIVIAEVLYIIETQRLKKLKDMHDRIIVATANIISAKLISRDSEIKNSGYTETVW